MPVIKGTCTIQVLPSEEHCSITVVFTYFFEIKCLKGCLIKMLRVG